VDFPRSVFWDVGTGADGRTWMSGSQAKGTVTSSIFLFSSPLGERDWLPWPSRSMPAIEHQSAMIPATQALGRVVLLL